MIKGTDFLHVGFGGAEMAVDAMDLLNIRIASPYLEIIIFFISFCLSDSFRKVCGTMRPTVTKGLGRAILLLPVWLILTATPTTWAETHSVQYDFLIDTSESMVWESRLVNDPDAPGKKIFLFEQIKRDALQLVKNLPESQPATIYFFPFDRQIHDSKIFQLPADGNRAGTFMAIQEYLAGLRATGQQTYIFSAIKDVITRCCRQETATSSGKGAMIFALTDGVDTEPNYPDNLRTALDMFRDWVDNTDDKPWLYTLHILPDNLAETDRQKLAQEKAAFEDVPRAGMFSSVIGQGTTLRTVQIRIPELDFGDWLPGDPAPERQISFDFLTSGMGEEEISLIFTPMFERQQNELPIGMDVVYPAEATTVNVQGSGTYVTTVRLEPTLVNPIQDGDFQLTGELRVETATRILLQPETIRWKMHLGRPPAIALQPMPPGAEGGEKLVAGELPVRISRVFRVVRAGRVDGAIEAVKVFLETTGRTIASDKPVILLTDQAGFDAGTWDVSNWGAANYAKVTVPLEPSLTAGRYPGHIICRPAEEATFQLQMAGSTGGLPFDLSIAAPPEPHWRALARSGGELALALLAVGAIYWWRKPAFQDVELQVIAAGNPENFGTSRIADSLTLRGRSSIAIGRGSGRLETIEARLVFAPEHHGGHDALRVRRKGKEPAIKQFRRDSKPHVWIELTNMGDDFLVADGDVLACGDLAIRISSVSYTLATLETNFVEP